ncbi:FAD-dependent oxidoreductase [Caldisalinibacter kiritimatiensis]|uniref:NADH oxidase n=1 Tax=Caldisalinibacter kiritimatiensis TaxID=1304284 RepID=R1CEV0_9FIRM|nr:FAD-dependent oxidoreductase [Caldisalinibacter kiritimatiensis]EOD00835.1 NADH oxidase [Caldisalinibacter kiritimatiensis]
MKTCEILVIGGGPAAITIAKNIKDSKDVTIIRPEDHSMIYCAMPYAVEGLLPVEKTLKSDDIVTDAGANLVRDYVESVDFDSKTVKTRKGDSYKYEKLIIATGAEPILPPIEGTNLKNVMTFKSENDLKYVMNLVDQGLKEAVVVGAGAIGIELAQALNKCNVKTHLVDMFPTILPNMMDADVMDDVQKQLADTGIVLNLGNKVLSLNGTEYVEEVVLEKGDPIKFDSKPLIVFAVGMRPSVDIFRDTELEISKTGIVVNEKMETNIPDVYAVGDCVEYTNAITGKVGLGKLATNAVPMARLLAKNLLGADRKYEGFYNGAATKVVDYFVGSSGLTERVAKENGYDIVVGKAKFTTAFPVMPFAKEVEVKLIADRNTKKIIGGQVVSGEPVTDKVDQITMAIQFGITVDKLTQFSYSSQPYQSFFPANNLLAHAAEQIVSQL